MKKRGRPTLQGAVDRVRDDPDARLAPVLLATFGYAFGFVLGFLLAQTVESERAA